MFDKSVVFSLARKKKFLKAPAWLILFWVIIIFAAISFVPPVLVAHGIVELPNPLGKTTTISALITNIANFILFNIALPFAGLMLIFAGFRFVTAQGEPEKINKAKQNFVWTITGVAVVVAAQLIITYIRDMIEGQGGELKKMINQILGTLNVFIVLLFSIVTIYFIWGVITYVRAAGDEEAIKKGKQHMIWGIIGMAIMSGAFGIINIIVKYIGV
jgi:hypothetical protein